MLNLDWPELSAAAIVAHPSYARERLLISVLLAVTARDAPFQPMNPLALDINVLAESAAQLLLDAGADTPLRNSVLPLLSDGLIEETKKDPVKAVSALCDFIRDSVCFVTVTVVPAVSRSGTSCVPLAGEFVHLHPVVYAVLAHSSCCACAHHHSHGRVARIREIANLWLEHRAEEKK